MSFDKAFDDVLLIEGGYSNNQYDSGGNTMYGITQLVARRNGYKGEMREMPMQTAQAIYRAQYWDLLRLDDVSALSESIAHEVFDTAVNCGALIAAKFLQRVLNAFNNQQRYYIDIEIDGLIGPATLFALKSYLDRRGKLGETVALRSLNALQGEFYISLSERRMKDEAFVYGWILKRVHI